MKRLLLISMLIIHSLAFIQAQSKTPDAMIKTTLLIVASEWPTADLNYDGKVSSIDAAIAFYNNYPDKGACTIWCNAKMNYVFNAVKVNSQWITVDPMAFILWPDNLVMYTMEALSSDLEEYDGYDPAYNYDAWYKYGRYCK